jgi:enoyl-CoA hydratase/carnithine racemase
MIEITDHGDVRELRLARPPANAVNPELVETFISALMEAAESSRAVVVSGQPGMFTAGLDIPELIHLDRDELSRVWQLFLNMLQAIACLPVPCAFALTGHAPAAGIVMAMYGDYRVMSSGRFKTGLNEVQVGLVVSPVIHKGLVRLVGAHRAERLLVSGNMVDSQEALELGLVDELADNPQATVDRAVAWCEQHIALPSLAMRNIRALARADLVALFEDASGYGVEKFVNQWFHESTQQALGALVERLKS